MYYENYQKIRDERKNVTTGKTLRDSDVAVATGIDRTTFSHWKKGLYTPKADKLNKIANYLGVTLEELKTDKVHKESLLTKVFNLFKLS